ncbi:MAG TPA: thiamine pyrophosphate-binding protein [Acidimicrobiales bacterium]|nr:thiamine pyrophosphate-binding protein [Acidimicrobiales bacterium]
MNTTSGGEQIARMLAAEGVEVVFGIIDGSYFGLYAHLRDHGVRLITPRHETTALHMAGAYARLTGRLGVAIASNGPGVANALPGVAVENGEGNRVLLITSWRRHGIVGPDRGGAYQYFDQPAVIRPMAKWSEVALSFERLPELVHRAFRMSWRGRPGVVHLTVPEDVMNGQFEDGPAFADIAPARYRRVTPLAPSTEMVKRAADLLIQAERPIIHAGSGVLHGFATEELVRVAELLEAPVTTSWAGRDAVDERHRLAVPMWAIDLVSQVRNEADLVLALGSRIGETDWWGKAPHWRRASEQRMVQVDVEEEMLGLNKPVDLAIVADAREFLSQLADMLAGRDLTSVRAARAVRTAEYAAIRTTTRQMLDNALTEVGSPIHSSHLAPTCQEVFGEDAVLVVDGGNTAIWANLYHEVRRPHSMLSTYKFGMLGAGIAQALGAKVAAPDRPVICITGDGAFGFHPQEIETAVRCDLPVVILVAVDRAWGMVKVNQEFALDPEKLLLQGGLPVEELINADLGEIRFDLLAESMGAFGIRVSDAADLRSALEKARDCGRPAVVHVDVDPRAHKFAPSLLTFKEMHQEPAG